MAVIQVVDIARGGGPRSASIRPVSTRPVSRGLSSRRRQRCSPLIKGANLPGDMSEYVRPLRPLRVAEHVKRYQAVDNYLDQFNKFKEAFEEPADWLEKGHLFIVAGDSGYGKTSMRQRCAFWMDKESGQAHCKVIVFDFSDENWEEDTIETRISRVRERVLRELDGPLDPDDLARIANIRDISESFYELGRFLRAGSAGTGGKPIVLVVLLPGYPAPPELDRYYSIGREGMVFLAEIFDQDAIQEIRDRTERRVPGFRRDDIYPHLLELGLLKAGDGGLLINLIHGDPKNYPRLTDPEVLANINELIKGTGNRRGISTSQLMKLLVGSLRFAMEDRADVVGIRHLNQFHETLIYT